MLLRNKKIKPAPILFTVLMAISVTLTIPVCSCAKNKNAPPENYAEILRAAAYIDYTEYTEPETAPATQTVVSGPIMPTQTTQPETAAAEPEPPDITGEISESRQFLEGEEPQEIYVITPSGKKYHVPGCRSAKNVLRYISKEEAESLKFTPCGVCKPE